MNGDMVVDTPVKGSVTTSFVCLKCPLSIFDRDFVVDLVCLPLRGLDVILGMNWLEHNYVHINCYNKMVRFSTPEEEDDSLFSARQLRRLAKLKFINLPHVTHIVHDCKTSFPHHHHLGFSMEHISPGSH